MSDKKQLKKNDFIGKVSKMSDLSKIKTETVVSAFLSVLTSALEEGYKVPFLGFGSFEIIDRKARNGRNPQTGEKIFIKASKSVKFSAGEKLKELVNK